MNLEKLNLSNLSHSESTEIDGGYWVIIAAGAGVCAWAFGHGVEYGQSLASHW